MKLLDASRNAFLASILPVLLVWSVIFYWFLVNQIEKGQLEDLQDKKKALEEKLRVNPTLIATLTPSDLGASAKAVSVQEYASHIERFADTTFYGGNRQEMTYSTLTWGYRIPQSNEYFLITLYENFREVEILKTNLLPSIGIFFIGCMVLSLLAQRTLFGKIWNPFYATLDKMKNYDIQEVRPISSEKTAIKEFRELNSAITALTKRAENAYMSQKHFIENTSHEIQTPLAVMKSKIELAFQNPNLPDEYVKLLLELNQSLTKLSKLNKALLLLSRIENDQFVERQKIAVSGCLREALGYFEEKIRAKGLQVNQFFEAGVYISANKIIFEILINNLIKNSIYHNQEHGSIDIHLKSGHLLIKNTAKNVSEESQEIPSRYQADPSNSNSTGLGLSIVKKICEVSQMNYEISTQKGFFIFDLRW
jgi:signal transduction histidine kinase